MEVIFEWVTEQLKSNQVFSGFIGGSILVSFLYSLKDLPRHILKVCRKTFSVEAEILSNTEGFIWISEYLADSEYTKRSRRLRIENSSNAGADVILTLGEGFHFLKIDGTWMIIQKSLDKERSKGFSPTESYKIRTFGRSQKAIINLIEKARKRIYLQDKVPIYSWSSHKYWRLSNKCNSRSLETIFIEEKAKESLTKDMSWFLSSEDWYNIRGISWHRGYLLEGPPGTGKSSLTLALATYFKKPIHLLNLSSIYTDDDLQLAFSTCKSNGILLIEDIDASQKDRNITKEEEEEEEKKKSLSLSSLLNQLDGNLSPPGIIVFMTTNYPDKLDSAILRPGRVDFRLTLGYLTPKITEKMIQQFYPDIRIKIEKIEEITPAELQGALQLNSNSMDEFCSNLLNLGIKFQIK